MKKYKVIANGVEYEVLIELVSDDEKAPEVKAAPAPAAPAAPVSGGADVTAPLSGTVTAINVKEGDAVKSGQVLMILEAMKMENEILAPSAGKVAKIHIAQGTQVQSGAPLVTLA